MNDFIVLRKPWLCLKIATWVGVFILLSVILYVNHYLPTGPMIDTGDVTCTNDGQGPCSEYYIEDVRNLQIPVWAKFFKSSNGELLLFGTLIIACFISVHKDNDLKQNKNIENQILIDSFNYDQGIETLALNGELKGSEMKRLRELAQKLNRDISKDVENFE